MDQVLLYIIMGKYLRQIYKIGVIVILLQLIKT